MPPTERARRLSRSLQARFRIDLFSALVERDFERCLVEAILAAERDAFRRGQEAALGHSLSSRDVTDGPVQNGDAIPPLATPPVDGSCSTTA